MNKPQFKLTKRGLFGYIPLGKYGVTIYGYALPKIRERFWAAYDYVDAVTDFAPSNEAQLWNLVNAMKAEVR